MCAGRCELCKEIVSKNSEGWTRRAFVFLVLFSVTLSALGISCFALLTVQNLSRDLDSLRVVLRRSRLGPKQNAYRFDQQANIAVGPIYETPFNANVETMKLQRSRRNSGSEDFTEDLSKPGEMFDSNIGLIRPDISNENIMVDLHSENTKAESTTDFQRRKQENFSQNFDVIKEKTTQSIGNVELIKNIETIEDSKIPNPLKEDVELFNAHGNNMFSVSQNSDLSPVDAEQQPQNEHHLKKKSVDYDEEVENFSPEYKVHHNVHNRHRQRGGNQLEIIDEFSPQAGRLKSLIAIHLDGDTSQYILGVHTNYKGNGHLRHAQKTYIDWKVSDWVETISATHSFHLKNGVVTVKDSGLYYIYAQIYYLDEHDSNGYLVLRNSEKLLQCKVTAPSSERQLKGNTCYTGGVAFLDTNDKISIDDISDGRYTLFVPGYSFFGMIKLGDIKGK